MSLSDNQVDAHQVHRLFKRMAYIIHERGGDVDECAQWLVDQGFKFTQLDQFFSIHPLFVYVDDHYEYK